MPTEDFEDEHVGFWIPPGEVIVFWSTGHEYVWYFGDSSSALKAYQRALTVPRDQVDQLPRRPSTRRVREHHVIELRTNRFWNLDPIRREEAMYAPRPWSGGDERKAAFDGKILSIAHSSLFRRTAEVVEVDRFDQLLPALANLPFGAYHETFVLIGSDPTHLPEPERLQLQAICAAIIDIAADHHDVAVIDRGHTGMVSHFLGDRVSYRKPLLVGVACAKDTRLPESQAATFPQATSTLEPDHSAYFLVPGSGRVDEAAWLAKIASAFAGIDPSVSVLISGEEEAWADVFAQLEEHRLIIALDGTGGIADLLSAAARGEEVTDERAIRCLDSGLLRTFPLSALEEITHFFGIVAAKFPVDFEGNKVDLYPPPLPRGPHANEPMRSAGFVAPDGTYYFDDDYQATPALAAALCQKYYQQEGDAALLLQKGWLIVEEPGQVKQSAGPTPEQMNTLRRIVVVVEYEVMAPEHKEREIAIQYLDVLKQEIARLEQASNTDAQKEV